MESRIRKATPFKEFKKTYIYEIIINPFKLNNLLYNKYGDIEEEFNLLYLDAILFSKNCHFAVKYREYLIWDYVDEFLKRYYTKKESEERLPRIANYYKNYLRFFCNPLFKDLKKNEIIQVYGDDKAKVYYKNNYGNYNKAKAALDNNIENEKLQNFIENENKNENLNGNNNNNNEEEYKSMIFNTTVRGNIENHVITRSSVNTRNSKNYDSFFLENSFSKANNAESKNNLSILLKNKNALKNKNKKKSIQESLINLLNNVDEHSFTYDYITEENSFYLRNCTQKDNFDTKTSFISSNKIKSKPLNNENQKIKNSNLKANLNLENKITNNNENNFNNQNNRSKNNFGNVNPWQTNNIISNKNNDFNQNSKNKSIYIREQINEQSKVFKQMYNDLLKTSTNKLLEKQKILSKLNQINSANSNNNVYNNRNSFLNSEFKKNSKEKISTNNISKSKINTVTTDFLKFSSNKPENTQTLNKDLKSIEFGVSINTQERSLEKKNPINNKNKTEAKKNFCTIENNKNNNEKNFERKKDENRLFNVKNSTNNYNIEGNNNFVINISPGMEMDFNNLQHLNNIENNIEISPEKLLYNITNRVGSPIMNSIVNINIKPILQVNNNQSNVNIYNSNVNAMNNNKAKKSNENSEKTLANTINPGNQKKQDFNSAKTKFLEFKNNKVSQSKSKRISSLSNNSNKSKDLGKKLSHMTNNIIYENQINALNLNFSLNKNQLLSSFKNPSTGNFLSKNSISQTGRMLNMIKANFDSEKRTKLKTKSFDRNSSQTNFLNNKNNPKFSNLIDESSAGKNNNNKINFQFYENLNNKVNISKEKVFEVAKIISDNNLNAKNKHLNMKNRMIIIDNQNQDFNNFANDVNKKLLSNYKYTSDKGMNLFASNLNQNEKTELEEKEAIAPKKIRVGSAELKNEIMFSLNLNKANNNKKSNEKNHQLAKAKHKINISEDNIKKFIKRSNTLGNSKETSIISNQNFNSNNESNILNSQMNQYQKDFSSQVYFENQEKISFNKSSKIKINSAEPIDSEMILDFSSNHNKRETPLSNNIKLKSNENAGSSSNNNNKNFIGSKTIKLNNYNNNNSNSKFNNNNNNTIQINSEEKLNLKKTINQENLLETQRIGNSAFKFGDFQKNIQNIISYNIVSSVNKFKNNNNKSSNNYESIDGNNNLEKLATLNYNSSFKDKIENIINNNEKSSKIVLKPSNKTLSSGVFSNLSNTKLNNYLLNSGNLTSLNSQSQNNNPNLLGNNSSINFKNSTINYQNTNSHKVSNSIQAANNKAENSLGNLNSIKILSSISKGNLINTFKNTNYINNQGNKKSISIEKANNLAKKKISIFKNNNINLNNNRLNYDNTQNLKLKNNHIQNNKFNFYKKNNTKNHKTNNYSESMDYRSYGTPYNMSQSPEKNENIQFDQNNLIFGSQSRNKSNSIFKLNTNPSNNSKVKERNNNSENKSISVHQGTIANDTGNILNMKLFDYIKNQEYVDLLKDTMEYNNDKKHNHQLGENFDKNKTGCNFNNLNYNKHVRNNKSVNLNFNKNLSKDSKKANSKTSSIINNLNTNFLEKTENFASNYTNNNSNINNFDIFKSNSKDKISELKHKLDANNKTNNLNPNKNKNILGNVLIIKELNEEKKIKLKSEISKANNFIKNKVFTTNLNSKQNENRSKRKITHSNNEVWINNPYIINSNNVPLSKNSENNFENIDGNKKLKTSKNRSIDVNMLLNNNNNNNLNAINIFSNTNANGNKFFELNNRNKRKDQ